MLTASKCFDVLKIVPEFIVEEGLSFCLGKQLTGYVKVRLKHGLKRRSEDKGNLSKAMG